MASLTFLVNTYWNHPVSNVSKLWHLHGPKNCYIYVAAKKEYRKNLSFRGRISSVGGVLVFRKGWRRFDSGGRANTHGLTQKARPSRGLDDHTRKIVVPSPVGEVKIASNSVLNWYFHAKYIGTRIKSFFLLNTVVYIFLTI